MSDDEIDPPDPPRVMYTLKGKRFDRVNAPAGTPSSDPIDVSKILQQNIDAETRDLSTQRTAGSSFSRRSRDYWLSLLLGNTLLLVPTLFLRDHNLVFVCGLSACVLFTGVLSWIFWAVFDRY